MEAVSETLNLLIEEIAGNPVEVRRRGAAVRHPRCRVLGPRHRASASAEGSW